MLEVQLKVDRMHIKAVYFKNLWDYFVKPKETQAGALSLRWKLRKFSVYINVFFSIIILELSFIDVFYQHVPV